VIVLGKFLLDTTSREVSPSKLDLGRISPYATLLLVSFRSWSKGHPSSDPYGELGSMFGNLSAIRTFIMIISFMERDPSGGI
jgi:hypothetical protein